MTEKAFELAGIRKMEVTVPEKKKKWHQGKPIVSIAILLLIILGCIFAEYIMTKDPAYMDLLNYNKAAGQRVFVWNRYDGERYILHDLVRRTNLVNDRRTCDGNFHTAGSHYRSV